MQHQPNQAGFTLLEAVVALAIVAMVVTSYLGIRTSALADGLEARNWRLAREIAEERMSEIVAGAHELPPQSGISIDLEQYKGFSYTVVIGESSIGELEADLSSAAAETDSQTSERLQWQHDRDRYLKASARGLSAMDYDSQIRQEEEQRRLQSKAPSETEYEEIAVVVKFPKLDAKYEGQKEAFVIKTKVSTLALSGMTPEQAKQIADAQGDGAAAAGSGSPAPAAAGNNSPLGGGK
jgi:prepilin-type N-terminal cleavage/methylation domain-containing protein